MLTCLHIKNFAIADDIELDLSDGLSIITGETGAGKSIIIKALGLVLGQFVIAGVWFVIDLFTGMQGNSIYSF